MTSVRTVVPFRLSWKNRSIIPHPVYRSRTASALMMTVRSRREIASPPAAPRNDNQGCHCERSEAISMVLVPTFCGGTVTELLLQYLFRHFLDRAASEMAEL